MTRTPRRAARNCYLSLAVPVAAAALHLIAALGHSQVFPMPDRILAASATLAPASRVSAASTNPAMRAEHDGMAKAIRALAMDAVEQAKSGHPGLPMGAADIARKPSAPPPSTMRGSTSPSRPAFRQGGDEIIGSNGAFVGMTGFGASGLYKDLY